MTIVAPIYLAGAHEGIVPHRYVAIERKQRCECCHNIHTWTECYALTYMRSSLGMGKYVSNLRPVDYVKYRLPIEQVRATKVDRVPFCHACLSPTLMQTGDPLLDPPPAQPPPPEHVVGVKIKSPSKPKTTKPKPEPRKTMSMAQFLKRNP